MKISILSAGSFSGINLSKFFMERGFEVKGMIIDGADKYPNEAADLYRKNNAEFKHDKISSNESLDFVLKDSDVAINALALIDVANSITNPFLFHNVNVEWFLHTLEAIRKNNIGRLIVGSSNHVYGNGLYNPIDENHPLNPTTLYGATKVAQEKYAISYSNSFGIPVTILRFSNMYGPHGYGIINLFVNNGKEGKPLVVEGGSQPRTFTHASDGANATMLSIENKKSIGEAFNVSGPESITIMELAEIGKRRYNVEMIQKEARAGDMTDKNYKISFEKAEKILGYEPKIRVADAIEKNLL